MASLEVAPRARHNLEQLIRTHSLPESTVRRLATSVEPLAAFPLMGSPLTGRWSGYRYLLGPWRWMIVVYEYHEASDVVAIVTIQDSRSANAATSSQGEPRE